MKNALASGGYWRRRGAGGGAGEWSPRPAASSSAEQKPCRHETKRVPFLERTHGERWRGWQSLLFSPTTHPPSYSSSSSSTSSFPPPIEATGHARKLLSLPQLDTETVPDCYCYPLDRYRHGGGWEALKKLGTSSKFIINIMKKLSGKMCTVKDALRDDNPIPKKDI